MGGLSAQQSQKWSFYLISKNQIVILMLVMTLMGRMKTVPRMKVLRLQMLLRKKNSFANLGYLDPCVASLRCAPEYKFIQPNLGANDVHQDAQKLEGRIAKAKASGLKSVQQQKSKPPCQPNTNFFKKEGAAQVAPLADQ